MAVAFVCACAVFFSDENFWSTSLKIRQPYCRFSINLLSSKSLMNSFLRTVFHLQVHKPHKYHRFKVCAYTEWWNLDASLVFVIIVNAGARFHLFRFIILSVKPFIHSFNVDGTSRTYDYAASRFFPHFISVWVHILKRFDFSFSGYS